MTPPPVVRSILPNVDTIQLAKWANCGRLATWTAGMFALFIYVVPLSPLFIGSQLDPSWHAALHVAFERGFDFGSQIVFTYGPLGFTQTRTYWPGLFNLTLAIWCAITLGLGFALRDAVHAAHLPTTHAAVVIALLTVAGVFAPDALVLSYFLLVGWAFVARVSLAGALFHAALIGILGLSKLTFLIIGGLTLTSISCILFSQRRHLLSVMVALVYGTAFFSAWHLCGQTASGLLQYLRNGMEIIGGYPEAMSLDGSRVKPLEFLLVAVAVVASTTAATLSARKIPQTIALLLTVTILVMAFRQGYIRRDGHVLIALIVLSVAALAASARLPANVPFARRAIDVILVSASIAALTHALVQLPFGGANPWNIWADHGLRILGRLPTLANASTYWREQHFAAIARARESTTDVPNITGTIDIYSYEQGALFARGLDWNPRPVFQSYGAYTPRLAAINAEHLRGVQAPEHLLVAIQTIDQRLPALDDGLSWFEMIERYTLVDSAYWAHLKKRQIPRTLDSVALGSFHGEGWVVLPVAKSTLLQATIRAYPSQNESLGSRLRAVALAPSTRWIEVRLADGQVRRFRFIPRMGESPFLLSPLIESTNEFAQLLGCGSIIPERSVGALRIVDASGQPIPFDVTLNGVEASEASTEHTNEIVGDLCVLHRIHAPEAVATEPWIVDEGGNGLNAHPPTTFRIARTVRSIELCTRMRKRALREGNSDGYVVSIVRTGTSEHVIKHLSVPPSHLAEEICISAALPPLSPEDTVEIRVEPGDNSAWDWVYISRVKTHAAVQY